MIEWLGETKQVNPVGVGDAGSATATVSLGLIGLALWGLAGYGAYKLIKGR